MTSPSDPRPAEPAGEPAPGTQEIPVVAPGTQDTPVVAPGTQDTPVGAPAAPAPHLPPHPGATTPAPVPTLQTTGPVAFVPGPPVPLPAPATAQAGSSAGSAGASAAPAGASAAGSTPPGAPAGWPDSLETGPVPMPADADEATRERGAAGRTALLGPGLVVLSLALLQVGLGLRFGGESFWADIPLWSAFATACAVLGLGGFPSLLPAGRRPGTATAWRIAAGGFVGLAAFWVLVVLPVVATDRGFLLTAALAALGAALWTGPARRR